MTNAIEARVVRGGGSPNLVIRVLVGPDDTVRRDLFRLTE